ncbi:hypothetical protein PCK2_000741 [Pneumocystis canis]|nr:hypothetical protein PCK2_000741 [Pneumocystis canis]
MFEFCPFEQSSSLLAVGGKQGILLLKRTYVEVDELEDIPKLRQFKERWSFRQLLYVQLGARVTSIAFSPTTYVDTIDPGKFSATLIRI